MWALAAAWHVLGNPRSSPGWVQALVMLAVGAVLWRPGAVAPLATLAVAGLLMLWEEAPALSNHWLLAGFVNLAVLVACGVGAARRRVRERDDLTARLFPMARLCLLGFYAFAGFAKLNSAFFDRSVSCAVFYFEESTRSIGLAGLRFGGAAWVQWPVIVGTAAVELAIPVLLVRRRTRHLGVVVALVFHGVLALDRTHEFFDFSSLLAALFVLFLPRDTGAWVAERVGAVRARAALVHERLPHVIRLLAVMAPVVAGLAVAGDLVDAGESLEVGWWPWQVCAVTCVVATVRYLGQRPAAPLVGALRPTHPLLLLVPLLVVANGITPYVELKTGFGWNMYSNLRTVDGESNHLLVRRTFPVTDIQADLVQIVDSDDPALRGYRDRGYSLTWYQLRLYLADHPDVSLTYERGGSVTEVARAGDVPELVAPVPTWREKAQLFRAVDQRSPERCVPTWGPAR